MNDAKYIGLDVHQAVDYRLLWEVFKRRTHRLICVLLGRILVGVNSAPVLLPAIFSAQILALLCAAQKLFQL